MVEAIDRDMEVGFETMMLSPVKNQKYQIEMSEDELTMAIGRTVKSLFNLLHQAQPQPPQMVGVVVLKEKSLIEKEIEEVVDQEVVQEPAVVEETVPVQNEIKLELPPKQSREKIEQMIDSYHQLIHVLSQAISEEQRRLKTQEQIRVLREVNRTVNSSIIDSKEEQIQKIQKLEQEKQEAQKKMNELKQTLQDM
ncbi:MAG: hypothetical protein KBA81_00180 [Rhabdochlamydiaceae bacterium]|nr:hypothetical protein [Rhabdochlamydiaceae bacterium]